MRAGERKWPVGLPRPLADAGTLLRYAAGESACSMAWPRPELVGRAVQVSMLDPADGGACRKVVLNVGALPTLRGAVPEVVLALPATSRAVLPGCTIQPLGEGPLLAFPAGAAPPGLLEAMGPFGRVEDAPPQDQPEALDEPEQGADDLDLGLELGAVGCSQGRMA